MSEDLRNRFKSHNKGSSSQKSEGIFGIWQDQKRIQVEEERMARELKETKRKAKALSRDLRNRRYGEIRSGLVQRIKTYRTKSWFTAHKKITIGTTTLAVGVVIFAGYVQLKPSATATLGDSDENPTTSQELPAEKPSFSILLPAGSSESDFDVRRTSPSGSATTYTFVDTFTDGMVAFQVTQQEVPDNFNLEKTATDFQATNIIQIDDDRVYHGLSEKTKVQSLIFIKNGRLVLISSPQKFTDDQWAAYITSLN